MDCLVNKDLLPGIIADSGLMKYAFGELKALGYTSASDGIDGMLYNDVIELLAVFVSQGHSNNSAPIILNMFQRLAQFQPLSPLRFTDDEWVEFADGKFQNIRRSCFFKESPHDRVYTIEGYTKCSSRRREFGSSEITDGTGLCWSGGGFMSCMTGLFFRRLIRSVVTYLRLLMPMALSLTIAYRCLARRLRFLLIIGSFSSRIRALSCSC